MTLANMPATGHGAHSTGGRPGSRSTSSWHTGSPRGSPTGQWEEPSRVATPRSPSASCPQGCAARGSSGPAQEQMATFPAPPNPRQQEEDLSPKVQGSPASGTSTCCAQSLPWGSPVGTQLVASTL